MMPPRNRHGREDARSPSSRSGENGVRGPWLTRIGISGGIRHDASERISSRTPTCRKTAVLKNNSLPLE